MSTHRRPATTRRAPANSRRSSAKNRKVNLRSPVVIHRKRRPKRKTVITFGGALVSLLGMVTTMTASLIMLVITIAVGLLTVILAVLSTGDTGPAAVSRPNPATSRSRPSAKPAPASGLCGAPTRDGTPCQRSVRLLPCPHHGPKGHQPGERRRRGA